jgi:hypothetical protein
MQGFVGGNGLGAVIQYLVTYFGNDSIQLVCGRGVICQPHFGCFPAAELTRRVTEFTLWGDSALEPGLSSNSLTSVVPGDRKFVN